MPTVRTRMGLARVNWVKGNKFGVQYLEGASRGGYAVLNDKIDEVEIVDPAANSNFESLKDLTDEELRKRVLDIRSEVKEGLESKPVRKTPKKEKKKEDPMAEVKRLLKQMSPDMLEQIKKNSIKETN